MFNKQVLREWEKDAKENGVEFAPEIFIALLEHIRLQDEQIENLIRQVEFYESGIERKSITDDYYS